MKKGQYSGQYSEKPIFGTKFFNIYIFNIMFYYNDLFMTSHSVTHKPFFCRKNLSSNHDLLRRASLTFGGISVFKFKKFKGAGIFQFLLNFCRYNFQFPLYIYIFILFIKCPYFNVSNGIFLTLLFVE